MHNLSKADHDALYAGETLIPYMDENGPVTWRKVPVNPGIGRRRSRVRGRKTLRGRKAAKKPTITKARPTITEHIPIDYSTCPPHRGRMPVEPADWCGPYDIDWCWYTMIDPEGPLWKYAGAAEPLDPDLPPEYQNKCIRVQFETRYPTVGEWVHAVTNMDLSQVQGARLFGQWQNFQVLGPHEFRIRFDSPGHKILSVNNGALELYYPDTVLLVGNNMDKISLLEVMPKGSTKMFGMGAGVAPGASASVSFRPSSWVNWPPGSQASRWGGYAPGVGSIDDEFRTPADCERLTPPFEDKAMRLGDCEWVEGRGWFYRPGGVGRRRGRVNDKTLRRMTSRKVSSVSVSRATPVPKHKVRQAMQAGQSHVVHNGQAIPLGCGLVEWDKGITARCCTPGKEYDFGSETEVCLFYAM